MDEITKFIGSLDADLIIIVLVVIITTSAFLIMVILIYLYFDKKGREQKKKTPIITSGKKYILNTVRVSVDGRENSSWHGWNSGQWLFTHEEALERKKRINHLFDRVEIIEHARARHNNPNGGLK